MARFLPRPVDGMIMEFMGVEVPLVVIEGLWE